MSPVNVSIYLQKKPLKAHSHRSIFGNLKSFKNDEKCFLFNLKSSLRSEAI